MMGISVIYERFEISLLRMLESLVFDKYRCVEMILSKFSLLLHEALMKLEMTLPIFRIKSCINFIFVFYLGIILFWS